MLRVKNSEVYKVARKEIVAWEILLQEQLSSGKGYEKWKKKRFDVLRVPVKKFICQRSHS